MFFYYSKYSFMWSNETETLFESMKKQPNSISPLFKVSWNPTKYTHTIKNPSLLHSNSLFLFYISVFLIHKTITKYESLGQHVSPATTILELMTKAAKCICETIYFDPIDLHFLLKKKVYCIIVPKDNQVDSKIHCDSKVLL